LTGVCVGRFGSDDDNPENQSHVFDFTPTGLMSLLRLRV
jgi:hypothetical protein